MPKINLLRRRLDQFVAAVGRADGFLVNPGRNHYDCGPTGETQQIAHSNQLWARRTGPGLRCSGNSYTCPSDHNSSLPETARSLLWFAAIQRIERIEGLAGLAPKGCFIAAEAVEDIIGQIAEPQETTCELNIRSNLALG